MTGDSKNVLILGARAPATLDLIRLLAHQGHRIYIAESLFPCLSETSTHIEKTLSIPSPRMHPEEFAQALIQIVQEHQISWVIPTCEEVFYVSRFLEDLQKYCSVFTSDLKTLTILHDKWAFNQFINSFHSHTPATQLLSSHEQLKSVVFDSFVLKPQYSRFAENVLFVEQSSLDSLHQKISVISPNRQWLAQKRIRGPEVCSMSVCMNGHVIAQSCYRHPFTAGKGAGVSFESFQDEQLLGFAREVAKRLNYTGFLSFDFIQDENGHYYPLECNPRITSGIHLFEPQDISPNKGWFQTTPLIDVTCVQPPQGRRKFILLAHFVYGLAQINSFKTFKLWISYLFSAQDVIVRWNDLQPTLWQFYCYYRLYFKSVKLKISPLALTTYDIEWNGQ